MQRILDRIIFYEDCSQKYDLPEATAAGTVLGSASHRCRNQDHLLLIDGLMDEQRHTRTHTHRIGHFISSSFMTFSLSKRRACEGGYVSEWYFT
jgi:hypothetical protein